MQLAQTSHVIDLGSARFRDQVLGCWMGKNCGGTLGAPLERAWGESEPFEVSWYSELGEGGIPNDDLEMQLIWLVALERAGPSLNARDLAQCWIDHIGYNPDEYGFCKTNLRLGLEPPVSGYFNNWFKDHMGCPIRSEIWACVAPGNPRVAVRYAFEDAICDHAGGESVYGELFNAATEAAAFVVDDRSKLIKIGLSYIPEDCLTARAIGAALDAHAEGQSWQEARERVLWATPHHSAQYSPINLGFQLVGWLYGHDFGDAICKAVSCGYDTDCTGATLGSVLGIIAGKSGLPARWTDPLGEQIATSEPLGGIRHASDGPNPIPATLGELAERIGRVARRVLAEHEKLEDGSIVRVSEEELFGDDAVRRLWRRSPLRVPFAVSGLRVEVDYVDQPAVAPNQAKRLLTAIESDHPDPITVEATIVVPPGWSSPEAQTATIAPHGDVTLEWSIASPGREHIEESNRLFLRLTPDGSPQPPAVPIVLVGARATRISGPYAGEGDPEDLLGHPFPPESASGDPFTERGRDGEWRELKVVGNALPLEDAVPELSAVYVQTFFHGTKDEDVWLGVDCSHPVKAWLNQEQLFTVCRQRPIRPSYYGAGPGDHTLVRLDGFRGVRLREGWNELLLKIVRPRSSSGPECHILLSSPDTDGPGLVHIGRTRYPWDVPERSDLQAMSVNAPAGSAR